MTDSQKPLELIQNLAEISPERNIDELNRRYESFFCMIKERQQQATLHIGFQHRHMADSPSWEYVPAIPHQTILLGSLNALPRDLYVPSPFHRDSAVHRLVGMKAIGEKAEDKNDFRFDVVVQESTVVFSLFTRLAHVYKHDNLAADIKIRK